MYPVYFSLKIESEKYIRPAQERSISVTKPLEISSIFCSFGVKSLWKVKHLCQRRLPITENEVFTMKEIKVNPENKDRVFRLIFGGTEKSWIFVLRTDFY